MDFTAQANDRDVTLAALLARRARAASDGRLVADASGGVIVGALVLAFRPPAWPLAVAVAAFFFAYGFWGISDRALTGRPAAAPATRVLRVLRVASATLGVVSVLGFAATLMAFALGNWIH